MAKLNINGRMRDVQVEADTPLLWVIREQLGLTGTKCGCGVAQCGACSVHLNGNVVRSCALPVESAVAAPISASGRRCTWPPSPRPPPSAASGARRRQAGARGSPAPRGNNGPAVTPDRPIALSARSHRRVITLPARAEWRLNSYRQGRPIDPTDPIKQ